MCIICVKAIYMTVLKTLELYIIGFVVNKLLSLIVATYIHWVATCV